MEILSQVAKSMQGVLTEARNSQVRNLTVSEYDVFGS